jgi:hypothetical protein
VEEEDDMVMRWRRGRRQGGRWERRRSISGEVFSSGSGKEGDGMLGKVRLGGDHLYTDRVGWTGCRTHQPGGCVVSLGPSGKFVFVFVFLITSSYARARAS